MSMCCGMNSDQTLDFDDLNHQKTYAITSKMRIDSGQYSDEDDRQQTDEDYEGQDDGGAVAEDENSGESSAEEDDPAADRTGVFGMRMSGYYG